MISFNDYLTEKINEPKCEWYNPHGNSSCAVVTRMKKQGVVYSFKYEVKKVTEDLGYFFSHEFKGLDTPLIWFVSLIIMPVTIPVAPFIRTYIRYKSAVSEYRKSYQHDTKNEGP